MKKFRDKGKIPQTGDTAHPDSLIAPGKRTRTMRLPLRSGSAPPQIQARARTAPEVPRDDPAYTNACIDAAIRPDLCPMPEERKTTTEPQPGAIQSRAAVDDWSRQPESGNAGNSTRRTHASAGKKIGAVQRAERSPTHPEPGDAHALATHAHRASHGQALDAAVQGHMEGLFGHPFDDVRIHTDGAASHAAHGLHADAFTVGRDVYFDEGRYQPGTAVGDRLLGHELTHVVQQRAGLSLVDGLGRPGDAYERQADQIGDLVARGQSAQSALGQGTQVARTSIAPSSTSAVQRQGRPDATIDATTGNTPGANHAHAADAIEEVLSRPDPIAGIGDPGQAWAMLAALPTEELLHTLDELKARGLLSILEPTLDALRHDQTRMRAALHTVSMAELGPAEATADKLGPWAASIEQLPLNQQHGIYRYLIAKRQLTGSLTDLLEGVIAMENAQAPMAAMGTMGTMGTAELPAPIEPGPYQPPGRQPKPLYIGNDAHKVIAQHYQDAHPGDTIETNHVPIRSILSLLGKYGHRPSPENLTASEGRRKPDILNLNRLHLYEIKPASMEQEARASAALYVGIFHKAGITISLGPAMEPGTFGEIPAPGGVFVFSSPEPGVISYQYREGRLVPVPVAQDQRQERPARAWRWELQPLTPEQQALATAAVGTALIILIMILLAPVGV